MTKRCVELVIARKKKKMKKKKNKTKDTEIYVENI
jgi:hypothetical protein